MTTRYPTLLCLIALVAFIGCGDPEPEMTDDSDLLEEVQGENTIIMVAEDAGLVTFRTAVAQADLDETLAADGPFTVFAPSDEAFNKLPEGTLESLLQESGRDQLTSILTYHVVPSEIMSGSLSGQMTVTTVEGSPLIINADGGTVTITDERGDTATVISADNEASNGVIHVIDNVLMPVEGDVEIEGGAGDS